MLAKLSGREIAEEAKMPTVDVMLRARDLPWNWLGTILRMDERRLVRQVLLNCANPTSESIIGDLIDTDVRAVIKLARDRIETRIGPRNAVSPIREINAERTLRRYVMR